MFRNRIIPLSACAGALVVIIGAAWLHSLQARGHRGENVLGEHMTGVAVNINQPLPAYHLIDSEQREVAGDELRRGRVLIVYLTTSCTPCVKEAEFISRLRRDAPSTLRIYGIAIEGRAQVMTFASTLNLNFPFLIDTEAQLARSLDIHYYPSKYLIQDGVITKVWRGRTQDEAELRQQLDIK